MGRKGTLLRVVTWSTLAILIAIGTGDIGLAEAKNEVRSVSQSSSSNAPSRPVYQKPKPKLVLPKQLQQQKQEPKSIQHLKLGGVPGANPNLVTQTVFGFLDFVTTVGNTVMVFTPQTKKVESVLPSSSTQVRETVLLQPTAQMAAEVVRESSDTTKVSNQRAARVLELDQEDPGNQGSLTSDILESSEYEPKVFPTSVTSTPGTSSDLEYINLMADSSFSTPALKETLGVAFVTSSPEVRSQVNVVTAVKTSETNSSSVAKGFTLKFSRPAPAQSPSTSRTSIIVTAERKPKNDFPTGLVSHNVETKVNNGVTTVHETKVLGTFIGTQYARILESSSSVLPFVVTASRSPPTTTNPPATTPRKLGTKFLETIPENFDISTQRSVTSSGNMENDERFNEELLENEEGPDETLGLGDDDPESAFTPEPTPTLTATAATQESTHYVLPQKDQAPAQIYASSVPSPNAYSRQPQIYVDVSPVNSFDYTVTATPSRKPFRPQNPRSSESSSRFTNRFNKIPATSTSTESNELNFNYDSNSEENTRRTPIRLRNNNNSTSNNRNRGGFKSNKQTVEQDIYPTTASSVAYAVTATPARKFTRGRTGTPPAKTGPEFKLGGRNSGNGPSRLQQYISPTTSTSIYKFKLNRPTGRWRFKPSPKPKVNIIKTKEEEDLAKQKELLQVSTSNGAVYPQGYNEHGEVLEIQNAEETRTESNELGQELEPELVPQTIRVATVTPTEFSDFENSRLIEIATIRSPYVFQAGNVKNTRYITVTKTFTKDMIQPTQVSASFGDSTLENILATRAPFETILEGSNNIATYPLIILGSDTATPPLETVTQTFSTTQVMLKTSILPVLYEGVTTLYTLTQSYFITRLVTAHKTIPPMELFQFVPTKSLTEFNTALQEAGTEHREQLLGSETSENDEAYANIVAPPEDLTSVGSDFDPSSMDEKFPRNLIPKNPKALAQPPPLAQAQPKPKDQSGIPDFANLTPDQLAFLRYFATAGPQHLQPAGLLPMQNPLQNFFQSPLLPSLQPQYQAPSSPVVVNTVATIVDTKTLRIQFGSKPTHTIIYSTRIFPTRVTSYAAAPSTPAIQNFFQPHPFAYVG